jgi:hypothetical protein
MNMAAPEQGLEGWQIRKLKELGVTSWKNAEDAKTKLSEALKEKARKKEAGAKKSGFAAIDSTAVDVTPKASPSKDVTTTSDKQPGPVVATPTAQTVDVAGTTVNVNIPANVPAPAAQHHHYSEFRVWPFAQSVFTWGQAFVIGASFNAFFSSRLIELFNAVVR